MALKLSIFTFIAAIAFASSATRQSPHYMVKLSRKVFQEHLTEIRANGFEIGGVNMHTNQISLILAPTDLSKFSQMNIVTASRTQLIPDRAPDNKFKTPDQIGPVLQKFATDYPDLASVESVGKSLQGRDIWVLKITQHVAQPNTRPAILFNAMHHAREVMSPEVPLDIAQYLLENYGKDAKVTQWVDNSVVYILPMLNPDGNNMVWTQNNMWRKNARDGMGVDINRNYPYQWNSCRGSSDYPFMDDYHGPSPASEPETNVLMNFVTKTHPVFSISFHSYSELVIYPYGCGQHSETANIVEPLAQQMASLIKADDGSSHYTAGLAPELLYAVDGSDIDWMYHEVHVIPYVIELNSDEQGFQPDFGRWRDSTVTRVRPAWQLLMAKLTNSVILGQAAKGVEQVHIANVNGSHSEDIMVHADGSYHAVVKPGKYKVTAGSEVRTVTVSQ